MSITVESNAEAAMCMEDYYNEIILSNVAEQTLYDIWNGEKYTQFRQDHSKAAKGIKCTEQCDMKVVGEALNDLSRET